ncbi:hypothetical protein GCM10022254_42200 [Actinomadura meridiana]|uniref:Uncharacterized protein n=1 Tax=Actinomadura meridiana TaxID=559626 RepID=A0ABP8C7Y8_9ACTN
MPLVAGVPLVAGASTVGDELSEAFEPPPDPHAPISIAPETIKIEIPVRRYMSILSPKDIRILHHLVLHGLSHRGDGRVAKCGETPGCLRRPR